jgi:hypothetical protein
LDPTRVLSQVPLEIKEDLTLEVWPIRILVRSEKENKSILMVKIL